MISETAAIIFSVSNVATAIIFLLAFVHKPSYKLHLIISQITTISFILAELNEVSKVRHRIVVIIFGPFFMFSTMTFTSISSFLSNLGNIAALIVTKRLENNLLIVMSMLVHPFMIYKFDFIITRIYWKQVLVEKSYQECQKVLDCSSQCILIYSQETKQLLF